MVLLPPPPEDEDDDEEDVDEVDPLHAASPANNSTAATRSETKPDTSKFFMRVAVPGALRTRGRGRR